MVVICMARRYIHLYTDDSLLFKKQSENSLVCYMFHEKKNDWITCIELRIYKRERERKERERESTIGISRQLHVFSNAFTED